MIWILPIVNNTLIFLIMLWDRRQHKKFKRDLEDWLDE